jgi:LuxR family maltose regulon positive regulatory protein
LSGACVWVLKKINWRMHMLRFSSLAKITSPSFTSVYPRDRLFNVLDQALERAAIWIMGPPGSGKTCLVSSYLREREYRDHWYQVDENDADIATFFFYMRLAVPRVTPRRGTPLPLLTPEYLHGVLAFTRRYCQNLFERLKPPFVLVFDNYQEVPETATFHEVIRAGVEELPPGGKVIFISRTEPPPILTRLRANEIMATIGWNELQLTEEEAKGIILQRGEETQFSDQYREILDKTQGWVAGLILLLEQSRLEGIPLQSLYEHVPEEIFDYFAGEIFLKIDESTRNVLLKTCFLPSMTKKMAEEQSGERHAGQILAQMSRNNNFITRFIQPEPVYQLHPLFREFLQEHTLKVMTIEDLSVIRRQAAALLEKHGMIDDALKLFRDSENWQDLVSSVLKWAPFLVEHGRMHTLEEHLLHIPAPILNQSPWLQYWLGICRQPFEPTVSRNHLENAFSMFRSQQDSVGTFLSWCEIGISTLADESGNLRELDRWITTLDALMIEFPEFPSPEIHDRVATSMFIALTMRMPQHPVMAAWEKRALSVFHNNPDQKLKAEIGAYLALHHLMSGDFSGAETEVSALRKLARTPGAPAIAKVLGRAAEALYYWRVGQFEECIEVVFDGLNVASITGVHLWDFLLLGQGLSSALSISNFEKAEEFIEKMVLDGPHRLEVSYNRYLAAWNDYLHGNYSSALQHTEKSLEAATETGAPYFEGLSHMALAIVLHTTNETARANTHINEALSISTQIKSKILEFMCLLNKSRFAFDGGNETDAFTILRRALVIGRTSDYLNFSWWLPETMSFLCARALANNIETDFIKKLITKRKLMPEISSQETENWPWEIKIYTLGKFEIFKNGSRITFARKAQKKPLELLKYILSCGGKDVPEEKITHTLWPDAEGDSAHQSFSSALHRLRKLLDNDKVIQLMESKVSLDPACCWVDYMAFDHFLEQDKKSDVETEIDLSDGLQRVQQAMALYKGSFLPGDTEVSWSVKTRDRLGQRFIHYVGRLAMNFEEADDWNAATELYKKGLEADNLAEEFYRGLMRCYLHMNMKAEGLAIYQRCKTLLSVVLGTKPSAATETLHKSFVTLP